MADKTTRKNKSIADIIEDAKKTALKVEDNTQSNKPNNTPKIISKKEITDQKLIKNIDDHDRNEWIILRTSYANKLYWLLVGEIIGLFALIICIGYGLLVLSDSTLNVTIIAVLSQTFLLVKEIVTNLFKRSSN